MEPRQPQRLPGEILGGPGEEGSGAAGGSGGGNEKTNQKNQNIEKLMNTAEIKKSEKTGGKFKKNPKIQKKMKK